MNKTISAIAVVLMLSGPAFAEGNNSNNGLPDEAVAIGQVDYTVNGSGRLVKHEVAPVQQASAPAAAQQQAGIPSAQELGTGTN